MPLSAQTQLNEDLLRAFDAFQSSHARLLDDFLLVQPSSKGNSRSPMGLLLLRQKLAVKHYQSIGDFWIDITTIFDRFSSEANHNSIRMSMANALHVSLRRHCCVPLFGNRPKQRTELQQALEAVGQLEALFMAYNKSAESLRQVQQSIKPAVDQLHQEHQARQQAAPAVVASTSIDISSALIASRIRTAIIPNEDVDMHQAPALPSLPSIQPPASVVCTPTGDSPPPPSHQKVFSQAPQVRRAVAAITPRASIPAKASSHPSGVKEKQQPGLAVDATAALTSRAEELERRNSKLVQMVVDLQAQLAAQAQNVTDLQNERDAAMSALAERLICVKQEKLDAQADAVGAGLKAAEAQQLLQVADAVAASARADKKRAKAQLKHGRQMLEREQEKIDDARHAASAIMSQRAEQLKTAEQERLEAQAEARKAAAQAAQAQEGKRKATTELEHEEKRRRSAEKQLKELSIRHRQLQAALLVNPSARSDCALCFSNPTSAVCLPCGHLVSCIACAKEWQQREGKCAICHKRVEQVVQTFLAADNSDFLPYIVPFAAVSMSRATAFVFLRALDVFEAGVDQRVLADFHEPRADPHNRHQEPMGLLQLRAKLNANAYTKEANWWRDVKSIFGQFGDDPPDSARRRMAGALSSLFNLQWRILMFGRLRCYVMWLARQQREVKDLKAAYIADQEARAAAASRTSPSSARALAAGATSASMVPMIKQPAAVAPLFDGPVVPIAAAAASSASRPAVVAPRGAGDEQAEREKNAAHLLAASVMASSPTSSPPAAAAIAASLSPSPVVPAPASVGASAAAAAAAASSSDAQNHEDANSVSLTGRLRRLFAALIDQAEQLERDKGHLTQDKQQFIERTAELATAESHIADAVGWAERIVSLKQTRAAGGAVAPSPAQLVLAGKRKAEAELESEAKRRRHVEGKLAELTEQMDDNDKCIVCLDKQPDVLFLRCKHLVCCNGCAETIMRGAAAGASCPTCRKPLRAKDVVKVFRA